MNFNDLAKAHVRTVVPMLVGLIITLALKTGLDLHGYAPEITSVVSAFYYSAARLAEQYVSPRFGWLLGYASPPKYRTAVTAKTAGHADLNGILGAAVLALIIVVILVLLHAV